MYDEINQKTRSQAQKDFSQNNQHGNIMTTKLKIEGKKCQTEDKNLWRTRNAGNQYYFKITQYLQG